MRDNRQRLQEARREAKSARDKADHLEAKLTGAGVHADPEEQFRHEVDVAWQRAYLGSDRDEWPLRRYVVGRGFLASVEALAGIDRTKVVEVCVDVVTGRASRVREVHALRVDSGGDSPQRTRANDGATAWRVTMQHKTPSARRLHYWQRRDGPVELSRVGVHDDLTMD